MELLKKMILSACVLSIVISVADSMNPGEKFIRQLRLIFSLIFVSGIVASAANMEFEFDMPTFSGTENIGNYEDISETADKMAFSAAENSVNDMISRILTSEGISYEKITADINMNEDGSININEIGYSGSEYQKASEAVRNRFGEVEVKKID